MNSKLYLALAGAVAIAYGIIFVLFPTQAIALYGVTGQPNAALNIQFFGSALLAWGVISWSARNQDWAAVRGVLIGHVVGQVVGLLVNIWGMMQGLLNPLAWTTNIAYGLLLLGALYCLAAAPHKPA